MKLDHIALVVDSPTEAARWYVENFNAELLYADETWAFVALGSYIHPAFYAGIPASIILCFHWLAIPILWGIWLKINNKSKNVEVDCCGEN